MKDRRGENYHFLLNLFDISRYYNNTIPVVVSTMFVIQLQIQLNLLVMGFILEILSINMKILKTVNLVRLKEPPMS